MLFVKLTGGPFFRGQYFEICRVLGFWNVHRISKLRVRVFVELVQPVLLLEMAECQVMTLGRSQRFEQA